MTKQDMQICTLRELMLAHNAYQRSLSEFSKALGAMPTPRMQAYIGGLAAVAQDPREFTASDFDNLLHVVKLDSVHQITGA
jgi:hypothetical protein